VKELSQDEIALLEEIKSNCLKKGQYIDDKAKDKFKMLCHLEDFSIAYYELLDAIKEVREYIKENMSYIEKGKLEYIPSGEDILEILDKVGE
jgi:hypothetical protein